QKQQPIESLIVTTKAHQLSKSLKPLLHRISRLSTIVLLHNGLGVIEEVLGSCFPHPESRPSFILANTSHGVLKLDSATTSMPQTLALSSESNPLMNPSLSITPTLDHHLPHLKPETHSLHHTLAALLQPEIVEALGTKWLTLPEFQTSALVKLTVNAALNPITALLETRNEALVGERSFERLAKGICHEASTVFALQAKEEKGFPLDHPLAKQNLLRHVRQVMKATGPNISSMCADVRKLANEQTEIDYINGYISKLGEKYGVLTPINDTLVQLLKLK
ncbi:uncharacterized protein MELLADRAFT_26951, partial [Melampsora larici-populina 98AG31]